MSISTGLNQKKKKKNSLRSSALKNSAPCRSAASKTSAVLTPPPTIPLIPILLSPPSTPTTAVTTNDTEREREKELDKLAATNEQYLGSKKPKMRVIKPSEKFRFRAGMDRRDQKKLATKNEKGMREEIRKKEGG
ncbi:hypothetical protein GOBAR_DD08481 [Gossypium barbadense]|nr:hypothetical protein GOBAR_DD08481 [Gossypium barbadense]